MKQSYTIVVFTENKIGLLNRISAQFTQRHINIESLTTSESEYPGIHRFTIVIEDTEEKTRKVVKQIEKQVEVLKAYCFTDAETIHSEIALYKIKREDSLDLEKLHKLVKDNNASVKEMVNGFVIIEKTGTKEETHKLFEELYPFGLHGFVRSGRVSLSNRMSTFKSYLQALEIHSKEIITDNF
ncbi:acetolactate synthase small subunit [Fulvivirga maritima]|uniref:acetolactate synthase small subunit n=1 Tax=Fulvivirga maritima TaxID=2904247 RepID=UPI001F2B2E09|nr:acetolactate synthase small subunit [Fulvivirga maritima]UII29187.1 acetolactate synthase small subunit [Fulvivirga maritima]